MPISKSKIVFVWFWLFCLSPAHASQRSSTAVVADAQGEAAGIIIKLRNTSTPPAIARAGGQPRLSAQTVAELNVVAATPMSYQRRISFGAHVLKFDQAMPLAEAWAVAERLMTLADVEYATPNLIIKPMLVPNDVDYGSQWSLNDATAGADLPTAWDITTGSSSVNIAVIDTGYTEHSDLAYSQFANDGYDFISDTVEAGDGGGRDPDARDEGDYCTADSTISSWHGTAVMSIIGALTNDQTPISPLIAGINWHAKMIPVRVLGRCGGTTADLIDAIRWAAGLSVSGVPTNTHPARVINMSLGGIGSCDALLQSAIDDAHNAGAVIVAAAGNFTLPVDSTAPANCNHVMAIAAHDQSGDIGTFSNYGDGIDLSAPGVGILFATCSSNTIYTCKDSIATDIKNGTSLAAPMVSGAASLLLSQHPTMNNDYVETILRNSARPFVTSSTCVSQCGSGMLDAHAALVLANNFIAPASQVEISKDGGGAALPMFWFGLLLLAWVWRRFSPGYGGDEKAGKRNN